MSRLFIIVITFVFAPLKLWAFAFHTFVPTRAENVRSGHVWIRGEGCATSQGGGC